MIATRPHQQVNELEHLDFFRGVSRGEDSWDQHHKEWHHFIFNTNGLDALINFNLLQETWSNSRQAARVIVILKGRAWEGGVDYIAPEQLRVRPGRIDAQFGSSTLRFADGQYHVRIDLDDQPIRADLVFTSTSEPAVLRNFPLAPGRAFSWLFVPRLRVSGWVEINGERTRIEDAPAYHDHNWGSFRWADDFAWEWGSALPTASSSPWCAVLVRATDRGRRSSRCQLFMLWRNEEPWCVFHDEDLVFRPGGRFVRKGTLKIPRITGLLAAGTAWDVPAQLQVEARRGDDWLTYTFSSEDYSQVVVPDDGVVDGITALCEVVGDVQVTGRCRGEDVSMQGRGVLELVR